MITKTVTEQALRDLALEAYKLGFHHGEEQEKVRQMHYNARDRFVRTSFDDIKGVVPEKAGP